MQTSGFTTDIQDAIGISSDFTDIELVYSSPKGYTRLFRAMRYGKRFILKTLKPEYLLTQVYQQALRKEFEIGFQLDHPNICRTIGFETVGDMGHAIILEYIDGFTLAEAIEQRNASLLNDIKHLFMPGGQLFAAMQYIHSKQIVHRDLKPANIMITHNGHTVKLIDFSLSDSDDFGILKQPAGTRDYIAPEQLMPEAHTDIRADIYSLGIILRQISAITSDRQMASIADVCSQRNIEKRPSSLMHVSSHEPTTTVSIALLLLLIASACLLVSFIVYSLITKGYV